MNVYKIVYFWYTLRKNRRASLYYRGYHDAITERLRTSRVKDYSSGYGMGNDYLYRVRALEADNETKRDTIRQLKSKLEVMHAANEAVKAAVARL